MTFTPCANCILESHLLSKISTNSMAKRNSALRSPWDSTHWSSSQSLWSKQKDCLNKSGQENKYSLDFQNMSHLFTLARHIPFFSKRMIYQTLSSAVAEMETWWNMHNFSNRLAAQLSGFLRCRSRDVSLFAPSPVRKERHLGASERAECMS